MPTTALDLARAARLFHALSDPTRLGILARLGGGERCVCDLQGDLAAAQSRLSFHLRVLKDAGLVTDRKEGRWSYYTLVPNALAEAHEVVRALAGGAGAPGAVDAPSFGRAYAVEPRAAASTPLDSGEGGGG